MRHQLLRGPIVAAICLSVGAPSAAGLASTGFTLAYVPGSLAPAAVPPGAEIVFRLKITKGPADSSTIFLDPSRTTLEFAACPPLPLVSPSEIPAGEHTVMLEFSPCVVDTIPDGSYPAIVRWAASDPEGSSVEGDLEGVDPIRVDAAIPIAMVGLDPPPPKCCVPPSRPAVTTGDLLEARGSALDFDPATGHLEPCDGCRVEALLIQYAQPMCTDDLGKPIAFSLVNSGGDLSGSYEGAYDPVARSVRLSIVVRDQAGNLVSTYSNCVDVDNVAPTIADAVTSRGPGQGEQRMIIVTFSECVGGRTIQSDWSGPPLEVRPVPCAPGSDSLRGVELVYLQDLPDDTPGFVLTYMPLLRPVITLFDRVGLPIQSPAAVPVRDGIPPSAPAIDAVDGYPAQGGKFTFSSEQPGVRLSGSRAVRAGYTVRLFEETSGESGLQPSTDRKMCEGVAQGPSITLTCSFPGSDRESTVYAVSWDTAAPANMGDVTSAIFVLQR